jgi:hypothetical protein
MRSVIRLAVLAVAFALLMNVAPRAAAPDAAVQAKIDAKVQVIKTWASDPSVVAAAKAHNASLPEDQKAMTQAKWAGLTILDPFVRSFSKNDAGVLLKSKKTDDVSEAFISDASGLKVAFLGKTTNWSHKGNPKHELPMSGKLWQGAVEVDESTGVQQIQVSVPVMDGGKPIGSLVVGLSIAKL